MAKVKIGAVEGVGGDRGAQISHVIKVKSIGVMVWILSGEPLLKETSSRFRGLSIVEETLE